MLNELYARATVMAVMPVNQGTQILEDIKDLLVGGVGFLGAAMIVWGAISIGINVHNGASGNGAAIASGVGTLVGGVIIAAASVYFGQLETGWAQ